MKKLIVLAQFCCLIVSAFAQAPKTPGQILNETPVEAKTPTGTLHGTLFSPGSSKPAPVVLLIAGSGPTDRDGNNPMMKNNHLKLLAEGLAQQGIASVRYDKRGVGQSQVANLAENELRFEAFIQDAAIWVKQLQQDRRFSKVIVLGHSEGSLIGMVASQETKPAAFVSVAGPGLSADKLLKQQLQQRPQPVRDEAFPIIDQLAAGKTVENINPMYAALFRPSVQPYLISWFRYDPVAELRKLTVPVLVVQGTQDLQVSTAEAEALAAAGKNHRLVLVENMNHILKGVGTDVQANLATYSNPDLPIVEKVSAETAAFIQSLK